MRDSLAGCVLIRLLPGHRALRLCIFISGNRSEAVKKLKTPEIRARKCLITKKYFLRFGDFFNFFTASDPLRAAIWTLPLEGPHRAHKPLPRRKQAVKSPRCVRTVRRLEAHWVAPALGLP